MIKYRKLFKEKDRALTNSGYKWTLRMQVATLFNYVEVCQ